MYLHIENREKTTLQQIRRAHSYVSLPRKPSDETLAALGYARIHSTPRPDGDVVTEGQPGLVDGVWYQTWEVRDYTEEERAERLEQAKADATQRINDGYSAELAHILADYPDAETKTWDKQESEARAWLADNATSTPLLDAISTARNMDKAELVTRITAKADAWVSLSGAATGKRQALEDQIAETESIEEVQTIAW